jgi:hypothetical protein
VVVDAVVQRVQRAGRDVAALAGGGVGRALAGLGQGLLHGAQQLLQRDGLFQEGAGAVLGGFDGGVDGAVAAHHDHRHLQLAAGGPFLEQRHAVDVGHPDVQQHQVGAQQFAHLARLGGVSASSTVWPSSVRISDSRARMPSSSSTTRICCHALYGCCCVVLPVAAGAGPACAPVAGAAGVAAKFENDNETRPRHRAVGLVAGVQVGHTQPGTVFVGDLLHHRQPQAVPLALVVT